MLANTLLFGCLVVNAAESQSVRVTADIRESYTVTLPKSLKLTVDSSGNAICDYNVDVDGSIAGGNIVSVVPDETFVLTQTGKDNVVASVNQNNKVFYDADFTGDVGSEKKFVNDSAADTDASGTITASGLGAGSWSGNLMFNISLTSADTSAMFAKTVGKDLYVNNMRYTIKGMVFHNAVAVSPTVADPDMTTEQDYEEIASLGFNTVRYLFNYNILEEEDQPGVLKSTAFDWMDQNIEWAQNHGIHIILDYHLTRGGVPTTGGNQNIWTAGEDNQEALVAVWDAISERYKDNPTVLGYGLVNEPFIETGNNSDYDALIDRLVTTIRANDTKHTLFIQRAQKGSPKVYVYPTVNDTNWVMEVHKYPASDMKLTTDNLDIPSSFLYYGNDDLVCTGFNDSTNTGTKKLVDTVTGITTDWTEKSFTFTAGDSNCATMIFEVLALKADQDIEIKDFTVFKGDKEVYNMTYNKENQKYSYSATGTLNYDAPNNLISITGPTSYMSIKDVGQFRFFRLVKDQEYTVKLKVRTTTGVDNATKINVQRVEYNVPNMYYANKNYLIKQLGTEDVDTKYDVPVFYGEIGTQRSAYNSGRAVNQLSRDMLEYMADNHCNFAYFVWHEKFWGVYTGDGLQPKTNPNTELIDDFRELFAN